MVALVSLDGIQTSSARSDKMDSKTNAFLVRTAHCKSAVYSRSVKVNLGVEEEEEATVEEVEDESVFVDV